MFVPVHTISTSLDLPRYLGSVSRLPLRFIDHPRLTLPFKLYQRSPKATAAQLAAFTLRTEYSCGRRIGLER